MSQNDMVIANQSAPNFRADLNDALQALASLNSGSTAPSTTYANMLWYDTSNNILKMRSEADDAWIEIGTLNQSTNEFEVANLTELTETQAENDTSTVFGLVSGQRLGQAIGAADTTPSEDSAAQTIANTTVYTFTPSFTPVRADVYLKCTSATEGYQVGDEVQVGGYTDYENNRGVSVVIRGEDVIVKTGNGSFRLLKLDAGEGGSFTPTSNNFDLYIRAYNY